MAKQTPLEKYILRTFGQRFKEKQAWAELEKLGKKLPSGGHVWTGADLIRYFEAKEKKTKKKKKRKKKRR